MFDKDYSLKLRFICRNKKINKRKYWNKETA